MTHEDRIKLMFRKHNIDWNAVTYFPKYPTKIGDFLDDVVLCLYRKGFDPNDLTYESKEESEQQALNYIYEHYKDIIDNIPLEVIYYWGIIESMNNNLILNNKVFGLKAREIVDIWHTNIELFSGRFTPELETILINKLNIKRLG